MLLGSDLYPGCRMQTRASLARPAADNGETASGRARHVVVLWASGALMGGGDLRLRDGDGDGDERGGSRLNMEWRTGWGFECQGGDAARLK